VTDAGKYWDKFYQDKPFRSGKAPNNFLTTMLPRLSKGKVLDIAMGEGANAVYLAMKGFKVKGFDISAVALEHANKLAKESGVQIETNKADLDLTVLGMMEYDTVIMTEFRPSVTRYYTEIIRCLKQGGTLLVEAPTIEELKELIPDSENHRNIYFKSNELLQQLKGLRILFYQESEINGRHVVQCLAQRPLDRDAVKYNLFDMHSNQKDSGPSQAMKMAEALFKKKD
jgi:SAM-dependent methyltransferase